MSTVPPREGTERRRDVSMLYLIKRVELATRQAIEEAVEPALTALQYTALTVLAHHPGITSTQLTRNSFVRAQTMAEMVQFLFDRGLVDRVRDESNRRQYLLSLSHHGTAVVESLRDPVEAVEQRMLTGFDAEEVKLLRATLLRCRRQLSETPLR